MKVFNRDLTGRRFGRLLVLERSESPGKAKHLCICDCSSRIEVLEYALMSGNTASCGCLRKDTARVNFLNSFQKHGEGARGRKTVEYTTWAGMLSRCRNPECNEYENYGGRGISVCERWTKYEGFLADMGRKPTLKHSLDRIDNDGNYEPGNVQWATSKQQARNKRTTIMIQFESKNLTIGDWSDITGIPYNTISIRHRNGWSPEKTLTQPLRVTKKRRNNASNVQNA